MSQSSYTEGSQGEGPVYMMSTALTPAELRLLLTSRLEGLKQKMVSKDAIISDPESEMIRGSFGEVGQGKLQGRPERMAIKEIRSRGSAQDRLRVEVAFARELKVWEALAHPNLLSLVAFHMDSEQGVLQFVSLYAEAGNVSTYLKAANPDSLTRLQLSLDTAKGLSYLHNRKICHGDLKGENVLIFIVDDRPSAQLCDFGLSRIEEEAPTGLTTATFQAKGTIGYRSPELVDNEKPKRDLKSDMWAWGCVVLEITTGFLPYHTVAFDYQIGIRIMQGQLPASDKDMPKHEGVCRMLKHCWEKDPRRRPPVVSCRDDLAQFIEEAIESTPTSEAAQDETDATQLDVDGLTI